MCVRYNFIAHGMHGIFIFFAPLNKLLPLSIIKVKLSFDSFNRNFPTDDTDNTDSFFFDSLFFSNAKKYALQIYTDCHSEFLYRVDF